MKEAGPAWEGEAGHRGEPLVWGEPLHHVLPTRRPRNNVAAIFEQRDMPIGVSCMSPPSLFPDPGFSCPHRTPVRVLSPCRTVDIGSLPWSPATHPCGPPPQHQGSCYRPPRCCCLAPGPAASWVVRLL
ncbi:hypothetical protein VULLAG_LOCUS9268 [Vulpes lagopus]